MYSTEKMAVLLATYNAEKYIDAQIESLLKQTYQEYVICIHDDGSIDKTVEIIKNYQKQYPDKIILLEGEPTGGAKDNFFYLMKEVEAPYYMFSDQDDVWLPNKMKVTHDRLQKLVREYSDKNPLLVSTDLKVVNEELDILSESMRVYSKIQMGKQISLNKLLIQNYAVGCTLMFNRRLRDLAVGSYNSRIVMHDWWLAMIAQVMGAYENMDCATILYRQHGDNSVGASNVNISYSIGKLGKLKEKAEIIHQTRLQAYAFCKKFPEVENKMLSAYSKLGRKNKLYRMYFHIRYGINKQGLFRKIGILLCC